MNKIKNNFYTGIVALLILAFVVEWGLVEKGWEVLISDYYWSIQFFVCTISILAHFITSKGLKNKVDFHTYYMGAMTVRMLTSLACLFIAILYLSENQAVFAINFLITYFAYTGFEIYYLLTNLRPDLENDGKKNS